MAVFVDKSAKDVDSFDSPNLGEARRRRLAVGGWHGEVEAAVFVAAVVCVQVLGLVDLAMWIED